MAKNISKIINFIATIKGSGKGLISIKGVKVSGKAERVDIDSVRLSITRENYEEALKLLDIFGLSDALDYSLEGNIGIVVELEKFTFDNKSEVLSIENFEIKSEFENLDHEYKLNADLDHIEKALTDSYEIGIKKKKDKKEEEVDENKE